MRIDQFVHTLNYGDAISNEALTLKRLLLAQGISSSIYVINAHEKVASEAIKVQAGYDFGYDKEVPNTSALILHYSISSPLNGIYAQLPGVKKALIYHNLTPVHWFLAYNSRVVQDLEVGRQELPNLFNCTDVLLADSTFNKDELIEFGAKQARVLPLVLDTEKWNVLANPGIAAALKGHGGTNILHVGRLAPNKCVEDIIKPFYFYHHKIQRKSKLWLIGIDIDTEIYSFELRRLVTELRLEQAVEFVGAVADTELKAFYQNSDAYVCMSEHEGFCVPLLEAMYFGLPVAAYDACAIKETLGDGGLLLTRKSPAEVAELLDLMITDTTTRATLIEKGKKRSQDFSLASFQEKLASELIKPLFG